VVLQSFWLASRSRAVGSGGPYFSSVIVIGIVITLFLEVQLGLEVAQAVNH
jgi:hypothetical protein